MDGVDLLSLSIDDQLSREWLTTNGIGGFASSTIPAINTRKYHGLLVAPLAPPLRQMVLLSRVDEFVTSAGQSFPLSSSEYPGTIHPLGHQYLRAFSADPFPRWAYQADGFTIEKQLRFVPGENTMLITYTLLGGTQSVDLEVKPLFALRGVHDLMYQWNGRLMVEGDGRARPYAKHRIPATGRTPEVFFAHDGRFVAEAHWYLNTIYRREQERGYGGLEDVWMPGPVWWTLAPGQSAHFACSTDPIDLPYAIGEVERRHCAVVLPAVAEQKPDATLESLLSAANQFVLAELEPKGRGPTRVIAGYPWSPPAGRDTLISLPGLLLVTGRLNEARSLLRFFASTEQDGLMPTDFPCDGSAPRYRGADVSLWFVNAVWQYLRYGGDADFVQRELLPVMESILRQYRDGTALGIRADAEGLLVAGQDGVPVTWMDAQAGDWVMTPRQGRAVEVNALWYNAIRIIEGLTRRAGQLDRAAQFGQTAERVRAAFNRRFWNDAIGCCYDAVGDIESDAAIRPNQLLAISLPFPVLTADRQRAVMEVVRRELLTPVGLRTLSPRHPHYTGTYAGPVVARDRAYHQGTVFPWLLGPYVTAMLRVRGRGEAARTEARQVLQGCLHHLNQRGIGQLCELFDGDPPHQPGGLPASARSVAEVLRCYVEDILDLASPADPVSAQSVTFGPAIGRQDALRS